jgi:hypothetical protein
MPNTLTPKEIAQKWDTDARTLRKFLRTNAKAEGVETPGKGGRWGIEAKSLRSLKTRFDAWNADRTPKGTDEEDSGNEADSPIDPELLELANEDGVIETDPTDEESDAEGNDA